MIELNRGSGAPENPVPETLEDYVAGNPILKQAYDFLTPEGLLFVEVGSNWQLLEQKYQNIPFTWLDFTNGGEGVFMLTKEQLKDVRTAIN